jgi:hypothetical protein
MGEVFLQDVIVDLIKREKLQSYAVKKLKVILEKLTRGVMPSASDLEYIKSKQSVGKPECQHLSTNGGCRIGAEPMCKAVQGWKHGIAGCAFYEPEEALEKIDKDPLKPRK